MNKTALAALAAILLLGACANLNPMNWFSASEEVSLAPADGFPDARDNRPLVADVTEMAVEPFPGGAILRAKGVPPTQGWWDAELVPENDGQAVDGVLRFRFVAAAPRQQRPQGSQMSREITAGYYLSDFKLANVRQIVVTGANNARTSRR